MKNTENRVALEVDRGGAGEEPNLLVCINGTAYLLPRGKTSMVPPEVAQEVARAKRAMLRMDQSREALLKGAGE